AQVLKTAGYATGIFGKWHLGDEAEYQPGRRGFDETFIHGGGGIGQTYPGSCGDAPGNMYENPAILHNGTFEKTEGYCTDLFFAHAIEWMDEELDKGIPFFACITPNAAHAPLEWPDRTLVTHVGRWPHGKAEQWKYRNCSIRDARFTLVNNAELYDLHDDPGEKTNVIDTHPEAAAKLRAAYDQWWTDVQPMLVNENVTGPKMNPFKELYWKQYGSGPDKALRKLMDPAT